MYGATLPAALEGAATAAPAWAVSGPRTSLVLLPACKGASGAGGGGRESRSPSCGASLAGRAPAASSQLPLPWPGRDQD